MPGSRAYDGTRYMTAGTFTTLDNISAFTIAAWMYRSNSGTNNTGDWIISKGTSTGRTLLELYSLSGSSSWYCGVNNSGGHASVAYSGTGWHHVALTFQGGGGRAQAERVKLWIDGNQLAFTGGSNTPGTTSQNNGTNLEIGRDSSVVSAKSGSATGIAHLIIIPGYELTQSQLIGLMHRPGDPPYTPGAYFPMDGASATTEPDICGNRDGTWVSSNASLNHGPNISLGKVR